MLLCYLAVQRYNFFLENKIFLYFFGQIPLTEPLFFTFKPLIYKHSLEIALEIGFIDAAALLRVNLNVGC